ncbi:MAG: shikimate dehydrogenase [Propionicimonas sp.]
MSRDFTAELVACLGDPVRENPTGVMQNAAFQSLGLPWHYLTIPVTAANLGDAVTGIRALGLRGANFTIPHKVAVLKYLDRVAPDAALIGAVNTVRREGELLIGENTDGKGFLRGLRLDAGIDPAGKTAVVLGAGGASRAIVTELALAGASAILVVNRSPERGESMVTELARKTGAPIRFEAWPTTYRIPPDLDLLVNATSIGLYPEVNEIPPVDWSDASSHMLVCDVVPNPPDTRFLQEARSRGLPVLDGLSMLVHQGAIGFQMWTGLDAPVDVMREALREAFAQ